VKRVEVSLIPSWKTKEKDIPPDPFSLRRIFALQKKLWKPYGIDSFMSLDIFI
jgi:hypothetical protein